MSGRNYYSLEENFNETIKEIEELKTFTMKKIKEYEDESGISKIQKLERIISSSIKITYQSLYTGWSYKNGFYIRAFWSYSDKDKKYRDYFKKLNEETYEKTDQFAKKIYADSEENIKLAEQSVKEIIDKFIEIDKESHIKNIEISKENMKSKNNLLNLIKKIGVPTSYYEYKTSRAKKKSEIYYNWQSEISNAYPSAYNENYLDEIKNKLYKQVEDKCKELLSKFEKERIEKDRLELEKKNNKEKALMLAKYDLELTDKWEDILDIILDKDKYLNLAHAMLQTRNDWSDGFYKVENAISNFKVETDVDKRIEEDILELVNGKESDGRIFRDCTYSYDILFGMVDEKLLKDYNLVYNKIEI